ncbi:MAG: DUF748 domain-containing protein, partial [Cyanothece sp. SIO1E1]|nr:DUF748 domain-containing protein [Cyanothece sp. SIO1E1]
MESFNSTKIRYEPGTSRLLLSARWALGGSTLILSGIVGGLWGQFYVHEKLVPKIVQVLGQTLDRPVQLGPIERVSLTSIRLGASTIGATTTDLDQLSAKAIEIKFNLLQVLLSQKLGLTIAVLQPNIFLDQDAAGNWIDPELGIPAAELLGTELFELTQVQLRDARLELAPHPQSSNLQLAAANKVADKTVQGTTKQASPASKDNTLVAFEQINASLNWRGQSQQLVFDSSGQSNQGGQFQIQGNAALETGTIALSVTTDDLPVVSLNPLLPAMMRVEAGILDSDLAVQLHPDRPLSVEGTADLADAAARIEAEPNPFHQLQARLQFQGQTAVVESASLQFGQIPVQVQGLLHLERGFDLTAQMQPVGLAEFMETIQMEIPVPFEGALQGDDLRVTGPFDQVIVTGTLYDAQPLQLDQIPFASFRTNFRLDRATNMVALQDAELNPVSGGQIRSHGRVQIYTDEDNAALSLQVKDLSADAIARA